MLLPYDLTARRWANYCLNYFAASRPIVLADADGESLAHNREEHRMGGLMDGVLFGLAAGAAVGVLSAIEQVSAKLAARKKYLDSLESLRGAPHDPSLRGKTLAIGRKYARRSGDFTETELMNDIDAACARVGPEVAPDGSRGMRRDPLRRGRQEMETVSLIE